LPTDETTPPVQKTNLATSRSFSLTIRIQRALCAKNRRNYITGECGAATVLGNEHSLC